MTTATEDQIEAHFMLHRGHFRLDANLAIPAQGTTALFGPSGCGKTTLLRAIAGLERGAQGTLTFKGQSWQNRNSGLAPHQRPIGYVFQEASLFDHLTVSGNLHYAIKRQRQRSAAMPLEKVTKLLGIKAFLSRRPSTLSGGERQRVAIARALLSAPELLLMDEPLAALDSQAKAAILPFLERLQDALAIPILYVSHDSDEVARLADHLVLMDNGRVIANGPTRGMLTRLDLPLAHNDNAEALVHAQVLSHDDQDHLSLLSFSGGQFWVPRTPLSPGQPVKLRILARDISLTLTPQTGTSILNHFPVTILELAEENPAQLIAKLDANGTQLLARVTRRSARLLALHPGQRLQAQVKTVAILA